MQGALAGVVDAIMRVPARLWLAAAILLGGILLGVAVGRFTATVLRHLDVPQYIEGTAFERTAGQFGTSTVSIVATLTTYFVIAVAAFLSLSTAQVDYATAFWNRAAGYLPQLFISVLVLLLGLVVGDKAELVLRERLSDVKVPQATLPPTLARYTVLYVAFLIALSQVGVATLALVVLLAAYAFALVVFGAVAFHRLLSSAAVGVYLLLYEPYGIGDEVRIASHAGVVQEVDLFVTHIENEGEEYVLPNAMVFDEGIVRVRE